MLANYLFAVLMPVCVCVSAVVTCECLDLDSSACAAGLLALQTPCAFVRVLWINGWCVYCKLYQRLHAFPMEVPLACNFNSFSLNNLANHNMYDKHSAHCFMT